MTSGKLGRVARLVTVNVPPVVSILVCSYNYERFVGQTIASALAQTWPNTEVIVVDDGSTDGSWAVIESFGSKITAIRQPNGGQGAAYNACFRASRGDWVIWLDCDDLLDPDCVAQCLPLMTEGTNKVAFSMRVVDAEGQATGHTIPYTMHSGDVRDKLRRFGIYGGPPGSGNFYRRSAIERFFPLDEKVWPMCADTVPFVVAAAYGRVAASQAPLGCYRVHKRENKALGLFGNVLGTLVETLVLDDKRRRDAMALVAADLGHDPSRPLLPTPTQMRTRVISWRVQPDRHPYAGDTRRSLLRQAWTSLAAWPGYGFVDRAVQLAWAAGVLFAPPVLLDRLVRMNASEAIKRGVRRIGIDRRAQGDPS
jgi:hypothetical protein